MCSPFRLVISCFLAAHLALIAGIGEGLHLFPGCGHAVKCGVGGRLFWFDGRTVSAVVDSQHAGIGIPSSEFPLILTEADCAICRIWAQEQIVAAPVDLVWDLSGSRGGLLLSPPVVDAPFVTSFSARAPPLG